MGGGGLAALAVLACSAAAAGLAGVVWSRRQSGAGRASSAALASMLAALAVWNLAYGAELLATTPESRLAFGDLKYIGICALTPAWLAFILCWTGRGHRLTRRLLLVLAVEPVVVLTLLALPATHDLVRYLPADAADPLTVEVATGPVFWAHLAYTDLLLLPATALFVASLLRRSRAYWLQAAALAAAALLPWVANLLFALSVGPFGRIDLTPVVFTLTGAVLTWGLFSQGLLRLAPLARSTLVERMTDGVLVLDAYGHVTDANPAARAVLGDAVAGAGVLATDVLPAEVLAPGGGQVRLRDREYDVTDVALPGRAGEVAGRLLVLRDVSERARLEHRLRELLAEQGRVAEQLSSSLRPPSLPRVPGMALAACYRPAFSGAEVGGDFYDVVAVDGEWAFTLGDVSGKGAKAAATTAQARYTLRTLALAGARPAAALEQLHRLVVDELDEETYLTAVHGRVRSRPSGTSVVLALGGHPQPMVVRACGRVEAVGEPGSAIGLLDQVHVRESEVLLGPGDALVLYTDGVSEARDGEALFGESGLESVLTRAAGRSAEQITSALLAAVLALRETAPADDIAVLVLQATVRGAVPPAPRPTVEPGARSR